MPVDQILDLLRGGFAPNLAWQRVLEICEAAEPSALWRALPTVDIAGDAAVICAWLDDSLDGMAGPLGLYLGLDTLNMRGGAGTNLELGWKRGCNTSADDIDWVFAGIEHGSQTLIPGLAALHGEYSRARWRAQFGMADYVLFLAYSGLVLAQAIRGRARTEPMLVAWGFHDGDILALCRTSSDGFQMICR